MSLHIQDPADEQAPLLHETILEVCESATSGGGAFAFATKDGVDLLLKDSVFVRFATKGTFSLIVGIDEITNQRALTSLEEASSHLPGLTVKAFYHDLPRPIFHPKFCWFRHRTGGFIIAGSGNLTAMGLRGNWEAFSRDELDAAAADQVEQQWLRWTESHASNLRALSDDDVRARAALNTLERRPRGRVPAGQEEQIENSEGAAAEELRARRVLLAEIPAASDRWNQANFDLATFRNFFGAEPGSTRRIVLQHVDSFGHLESVEPRQSVSVRSRNFRFELGAAAGLAYPAVGRPIGVFIEIAPRTFLYRLLMPSNPQHRIVDGCLDALAGPARTTRMRRVTTDAETLRQAWPDSPLWRVPLEVTD